MNSVEFLRELVAFPTVSANPNLALVEFCAEHLRKVGAEVTLIRDPDEAKANLYATIGPRDVPGVLLSGHTDVVPVEGQDWTVPPFELTERDGKLFGRGTTDMKGFVACALRIALKAADREMVKPLHLALSYDEEIGCVGVRSMIDMLADAPFRPKFCIVGEPTLMSVATGHKGKTACQVTCTGKEAHSALAPTALNALHLACDMAAYVRELQAEIAESSGRDEDYDIPYTTLHVGQIAGGVALNIVPNHAEIKFEIRNLQEDNPEELLARISNHAATILEPLKQEFPEAAIDLNITNTYPPLSTAKDAEVVNFVKSLTGSNSTMKVAFGTEGGLFSSKLGVPTVVCGPGSMAQGHKPDEFVSMDQLSKCDQMLDELLLRLEAGV
ncbi:MAG: acetylornithine deacetylase [Rhizobiaceae bacterium]|nr:acetylornithine deacetylase [Rhizobiaceae bacterium]